jgi:hypothetical protein
MSPSLADTLATHLAGAPGLQQVVLGVYYDENDHICFFLAPKGSLEDLEFVVSDNGRVHIKAEKPATQVVGAAPIDPNTRFGSQPR